MRVSERQKYWITQNRLNRARTDNVETLNKISTQKEINRVQDNPIDMVRAMKLKDSIAELETYKSNIDYSRGFLDVTESSIASMHEKLGRAQELALSMANDTFDGKNRAITVKEVKEILREMIQLANSKFGNRYVFAGFRSMDPPLSMDGDFLGDDGKIFLQISPDHYKNINISGREIFEANEEERAGGHFSLMNTIGLLVEGLEGNAKHAIFKSVDEIAYQMDKLASFQASVGAVWTAVNEAGKRTDLDHLTKTSYLSNLEDADIFKVSSDFKRTESVLQSTLLASNKMLQPSLLNFMQ